MTAGPPADGSAGGWSGVSTRSGAGAAQQHERRPQRLRAHGYEVFAVNPNALGITVTDGGCPLLFGPPRIPAHRVVRWVLAGKVPRPV